MHKFHSNKIFQNQLCSTHFSFTTYVVSLSFTEVLWMPSMLPAFLLLWKEETPYFLSSRTEYFSKSRTTSIFFFFFCCPFSITKEPSEILVIGSDYWVTLYLVIITFLSKATSHLTTWSSNSILNSHTFLQPMVSLLPYQSWVLYIFF